MTISNLTKMAESYPNGLKKQWKKEKLLVTSNFSFSDSVFKRLFPRASKGVIVWEWVKGKNCTKCFEIRPLILKFWSGQIRTDAGPYIHQSDVWMTMSRMSRSPLADSKNITEKGEPFPARQGILPFLDSDFFSEQTFACLMPCFQYRNV